MSGVDSRKVVWASVSALMRHRWQGENISRLAREAKIGPATVARLKQQETSVGLEVLDRISEVLGVETWQLLVPGMDAAAPPVLLPVSQAEREFYARMLNAAKVFKGQ
jgi:transcriptional regulator with XRE-family HTH domain